MASAIKSSVTSALDPTYNKSKIKYEKLDLSPIGEQKKIAFLLRHVLTHAECAALIDISEKYGYERAMINIRDGEAVVANGYRDGERVMIDDADFAATLFNRISSHLPQEFVTEASSKKPRKWRLLEVNERMRFLRYGINGKFKPHSDGAYVRKRDEVETQITLQIYLNEGFDGGETTFLEYSSRGGKRIPIVPETGMILVFEHNILHEGSIVKGGTKYTIRTDVLYQVPKSK